MPIEEHPSAVYHLAGPGQIKPGRLVYVDDREDSTSDIYLHHLHVRSDLVWELNWLTRHQVGDGLWRQRWTNPGRMQEPPEGLGIAVSRWEIVPKSDMPRGRTVFPAEQDGSCIWKIRSGCCTGEMRDEMNRMLERIAGDGLWLQSWYERGGRSGLRTAPDPLLASPTMPLNV